MAVVETVDPGVQGVREAVERYVERYPDYEGALRLYGAVMELQQKALEEVGCSVEMDVEERDARLGTLVTMVDAPELEVDPVRYRSLVKDICTVMEERRPGGFEHSKELYSWDGLSDENLRSTMARVLAGEELPLTSGWEDDSDKILASNILWESLAPFYRKCGSILASGMDQSIWQRGHCPVCGSAPLMGFFRNEDGLWLVECSLCHTLWNLQRASCPFCSESLGSLEFLYIEDEPGKRVQYCSSCKVYIKTVNLRGTDKDVLLPLEDIVTAELDLAASEEGLKPAGRQ